LAGQLRLPADQIPLRIAQGFVLQKGGNLFIAELLPEEAAARGDQYILEKKEIRVLHIRTQQRGIGDLLRQRLIAGILITADHGQGQHGDGQIHPVRQSAVPPPDSLLVGRFLQQGADGVCFLQEWFQLQMFV
jgi:hypothetical protein